jgi:two-component system copper resistance phosphate regulon response regulator CusR
MSTSTEGKEPTGATILLIDAEVETLTYLHKGLSKSGFCVDRAINGERGLSATRVNTYDLIVLEVLLPEQDGWSVIREMRAAGDDTPVLFLTSRDSTRDCVKALEMGADDYMVKPFAFSELLARIRAILRRRSASAVAHRRIVDLDIDISRGYVTRAGRRLDLTRTEFSLLCLLVQHAGEVLTRKLLAEAIWKVEVQKDAHVVDVAIRRLRTKVDDPFPIKLIHSVRGVGYRLYPLSSPADDVKRRARRRRTRSSPPLR